MKRIVVGMSGSSGVIYGIRILEILRENPEVQTHLILSHAAKMNIGIETDWALQDVEQLADEKEKAGNLSEISAVLRTKPQLGRISGL